MKFLKSIYKITLISLLILSFQLIAQQQPAAKAEIILDSYSLEKSPIIPIGILIELEKGWHIYWRNPGDSGMPTTIEFDLPEGSAISEIMWAVPKAFEYEGMSSYGYESKVLLLANLSIPESFSGSSINLTAHLRSLICKDICIPYNSSLSKEIKLAANYSSDNQISELFSQTRKSLPEVKNDFSLTAGANEEAIIITISDLKFDAKGINSLYFLPYDNGIFKNSINQKFSADENKIKLVVEYDPFKTEVPDEAYGILVFDFVQDTIKSKKAFEIKTPINKSN